MIKRIIDIIISASALLLLLPFLAIVALLIRRKLGSPILFAQVRPGLDGQPFCMVKFRTMTDARDADSNLLSDTERLPPFGQWLRATSLDELPGLWNVLNGDMSLVGPRPLLMQYLAVYSPDHARRHLVKPGLTGWAQINGRNALSWDEKFALDNWYVDNHSLRLDLRILWITAFKVLTREGINAGTDTTMPVFTGSKGNEAGD